MLLKESVQRIWFKCLSLFPFVNLNKRFRMRIKAPLLNSVSEQIKFRQHVKTKP